MEKKYYAVDSKTLAIALNYCGFSYFKVGDRNNPVYSFENTLEFREALTKLNSIRRKNNNYNK